jgi:hypothetical protein
VAVAVAEVVVIVALVVVAVVIVVVQEILFGFFIDAFPISRMYGVRW